MAASQRSRSTAAGLFNIGSGASYTWLSLTRAMFAAMDRVPQIEFIDMPDSLRDRYQYFTQADVSLLQATGYDTPATPLADAVADYIQRYLVPDHRLGDEAR